MKYTIKRIGSKNLDVEILKFIVFAGERLNELYGQKYNFNNFPIREFVDKHYFTVCYRDKHLVGFMAASILPSFFDNDCVTLKQNLLFGLPNTRASLLLLKDFIDFGKSNANHIITMIGERTNISRRSLERLGFKKLEESYRMEIK